jgi:hypothetical protein
MIRKLLVVFASGLLIAVVSLSAAFVIGGPEMAARFDKGGWSFDGDGDQPSISRTFAFEGIKTLTVEVPMSLTFTKGDKPEMIVSGPEKLMNALRWENGRLWRDGKGIHFGKGIEVSIAAPQLPDLVIEGASEAELAGLDQPSLSIDAAGALDLTGKGKVATLKIGTRGASNVDLSAVEARDATIDIAGAGDVDIAANGKVDATISGAGDITLHRKPAVLTSRINGAGSINHSY